MESDREKYLRQVNQLEGGEMYCPRGMCSVVCEHLTQRESAVGYNGCQEASRDAGDDQQAAKEVQFTGRGAEEKSCVNRPGGGRAARNRQYCLTVPENDSQSSSH